MQENTEKAKEVDVQLATLEALLFRRRCRTLIDLPPPVLKPEPPLGDQNTPAKPA